MTIYAMPDPARIGNAFFNEGRFWTMEVGVCPNRESEHSDLPDMFEAVFMAHPGGFVTSDGYRCTVCSATWDGDK